MLCSTCACLGISLLFSSDEEVLAQGVDLPDPYFWHENAEILCFRHSRNVAELQRSASEECKLCKTILKACESVPVAHDEVARQLPLVLYRGGPAQIHIALDSEEEGLVKLCVLDVSRDCATRDPLTEVPLEIYEKVHPDPASSHCTALANHWLTTCTNDHGCITPGSFSSNSVTRFLRIDPSTSDVFLAEFAPNDAPSRWVALSYCWGQSQKVMLTRSSVADLKKGIRSQDLDATICHAIFVTHALNLEYLWVDALCVFQDGTKEDWLAQSSKMQEVYEKSYLTLVAAETSSVRDGFLVRRNEQYVDVVWELNIVNDHQSGSNVVCLSQQWDPARDKLTGPWSARGWTLQEGLLPNRLLYYTATQMVWRCCKETRYERGLTLDMVQQIADEFEEEGGRNFWAFDLFSRVKLMPWYVESLTVDTRREKHRLWYELVEEYSARRLANLSDRPVAVSALAAKYHNILGTDRYVAGLWEVDIVRGLLWYVIGAKALRKSELDISIEDTCSRPTWSWLHVAAGHTVRNDHASYMDCKDLARVENIQVDYEHPLRPFGNTRKAVLRLCGRTLFFDRLYTTDWRSSETVSAFERHISQLIEDDYGKSAVDLTNKGGFAAVLMLKHLSSLDHRADVLVLEAVDQEANASPIYRRRGVVQLCYFSVKAHTLRYDRQKYLLYRLGLSSGPRRVKHLSAKAVFDEMHAKPWPWQDVTIV